MARGGAFLAVERDVHAAVVRSNDKSVISCRSQPRLDCGCSIDRQICASGRNRHAARHCCPGSRCIEPGHARFSPRPVRHRDIDRARRADLVHEQSQCGLGNIRRCRPGRQRGKIELSQRVVAAGAADIDGCCASVVHPSAGRDVRILHQREGLCERRQREKRESGQNLSKRLAIQG